MTITTTGTQELVPIDLWKGPCFTVRKPFEPTAAPAVYAQKANNVTTNDRRTNTQTASTTRLTTHHLPSKPIDFCYYTIDRARWRYRHLLPPWKGPDKLPPWTGMERINLRVAVYEHGRTQQTNAPKGSSRVPRRPPTTHLALHHLLQLGQLL